MKQKLQNAINLIVKSKHSEFTYEVVNQVLQELNQLIQEEIAKEKVNKNKKNGSK